MQRCALLTITQLSHKQLRRIGTHNFRQQNANFNFKHCARKQAKISVYFSTCKQTTHVSKKKKHTHTPTNTCTDSPHYALRKKIISSFNS